MSQPLGARFCRIVAPEKLSDRFLHSGVIAPDRLSLSEGVLLAYIFEVSKPWFSSSRLFTDLELTLRDEYPSLSATASIGDQFERLLRTVNQTLNRVSESGETDWIGNLSGIIFVLAKDQLHFSQTGRSPAYLLQKNRIRQITDDPGDERELHPLKTFSNISSGGIQPGDAFLLANTELYREISLDALRRVISATAPAISCQTISKELKKSKNGAVTAIVLGVCNLDSLPEGETSAHEFLLEHELENPWKKFRRKATPVVVSGQALARRAGQASLEAAKQTHAVVTPKAKALTKQGVAKVSELRARHTKPSKKQSVERIYPKNKPEKQTAPKPVKQLVSPKLSLASLPLQPLSTRLRTPKVRKQLILAAAIALIALSLFAVMARKNHTASPLSQPDTHTADLIVQAREFSQKASNAVTLNQPDVAAKDIESAQKVLASIQGNGGVHADEIQTLWQEVTTQADSLSSTTRLSGPAATYILTSEATRFVSARPFFYAIGSGSSLLRARTGDTGNLTTDVPLPQSETITDIAPSRRSDTVAFALTHSNHIYRIVQSGETTKLVVATPDGGQFATADALASYTNNLYLLDGKTGLLWRYAATPTGYAKGVSLIDINSFDLKQGISLAVDGSIYILKSSGTLQRYTANKLDGTFVLKGQPYLDQTIVNPLQVITDENMANIYILDGGITSAAHSMARVLEFSKDGSFVRAYGFPTGDTQVKAFGINPQDHKLWILNGKSIQEFAI